MHVLVVENSDRNATGLAASIRELDARLSITTVAGLHAAEAIIASDQVFDAALVDLDMWDSEQRTTALRLRYLCPKVAVVVVTQSHSHEIALKVIRAGIQDYLPKCEATPERVLRTIWLARERHVRELRLNRLACVDQLTGILNRRGLVASVSKSNEAAARLNVSSALMTVDLDGFKAINDTFGHSAGDQILKQVSQRIARCIRRNDVVGRAGGDEFWVVVNGIRHAKGMQAIADKILASLSAPFRIESRCIRSGASAGIALAPDHADDANHWIRNSDAALYAAKRQGKNRWVMYQTRLEQVFDTAGMQVAH
jgi:diguanylate cyclase (GGDEF)-like protein